MRKKNTQFKVLLFALLFVKKNSAGISEGEMQNHSEKS
jgi:hypothetical protein